MGLLEDVLVLGAVLVVRWVAARVVVLVVVLAVVVVAVGSFSLSGVAEQVAQQEGALVAVWRMPRSSLEIAGAGQLSLCLPSSCQRYRHLPG